MLVMTRDVGDGLRIGDHIKVKVLGVNGTRVRLGIIAPDDVPVNREEIAQEMEQEQGGAAGTRSLAASRKPKQKPQEP
ncbi:MAG TPA: carbon storage regulator [Phycisphaerae bacterium]|nr:carbon storage regulator [Phycisphaerae bacterium]